MGAGHFTFMGGEPLMRDGVFDLIKHANSKNVFVKLQTNGSLITTNNIKQLEDSKVSQVEVSLDGTTPDTNDMIRGVGSFDKAINALEILRDSNIPKIGICFTITKYSQHQLYDLIVLARKYRVEELFLSIYVPMTKDRDLINELTPTNIGTSVNDVIRNNPDMVIFTSPPCEAAKTYCAISPSGDVRPCTLSREIAGSVKNSSFEDIWLNSELMRKVREPYNRSLACRFCKHKYECRFPCIAKCYYDTKSTFNTMCVRKGEKFINI